MVSSLWNVTDWAYGGVDSSIKGNGGPHCAGFLSPQRRFLETCLACLLSMLFMYLGYNRMTIPPVPKVVREDRGGKRALLILMCLIFGIEIGFKFASKTVIYILNPCHVITAIQIGLLAAPPTSRWVTIVYRIQIHCLNGALLALFFPVLNTRFLPCETETYWIQHCMMLVIPFYLMRTGISGVYTVEDLKDFSWGFFTLGLQFLYHFLVLQTLGLLSEVNLNSMLCPAVSDPFYGPNYRLWALGHQTLLIIIAGKVYTAVCLAVLEGVGSVIRTGDTYITLIGRMPHLCDSCSSQMQNGDSVLRRDVISKKQKD